VSAAALAAEGVVKRYGGALALGGVSLTVRPGELFGLLGPNGAGKSTLVKIACGLVRASEGRVAICGEPAGSRAANARLGYLAELFRFPEWLRAREVLELHQELAGSGGAAAEAERLLALVGLADAAERRVAELSKGMQQRLGIAQALVGDPRLLLLDEPTSALDPAGRHVVRELLTGLRERGVAVVLSSHLLSEVELVCDRVAIVDRGRVVAEGAPSELGRPQGVVVETGDGERRFDGATREQVPGIVAGLVEAGERIFGVRVLAPTLEQVYLEVVRGEPS
jgi:ABC-2 type transport system ATP-binding protein